MTAEEIARKLAEKALTDVAFIGSGELEHAIDQALKRYGNYRLEAAADAVWAHRWEPPYLPENSIVEFLRSLKEDV